MEYLLGPIVAAVVSMAFSEQRCRQRCSNYKQDIVELKSKVFTLETSVIKQDTEMPKKIMTTLLPVAKEVSKLKQAVGI